MADLITLQEFKDYLGKGAKANTASDELIASCVAAASNMVRDALSLDVDLQVYDETYDGNGRPFLPLRMSPLAISFLPTVTENGVALTVAFGYNPAVDVVADVEKAWLNRQPGPTPLPTGASSFPGRWTVGFQNVHVVYTAGFATVPAEFKMLTRYLAARYFKESDERRVGVSRRGVGSHSTDFLSSLPEMYQEIVRVNRRTYFAR